MLPADHHDERVGERIEAFLEGPQRTTRTGTRTARPASVIRARTTIPMDTRADWDQALRQEDARTLRYGRPASVMVAVMRLPPDEDGDRYAGRVGKAIRFEARETDRVARVGPDRFHVLLPETLESDAAALAERVRLACLALSLGNQPSALEVRTSAATPVPGQTLRDALRIASTRLADDGPDGVDSGDEASTKMLKFERRIVAQPGMDGRDLDDGAGR